MTKRIIDLALCAVFVLATLCATARAEDPRDTPLVKAVKRAKASVVNIHSEKTVPSSEPVFASRKGRKVNGMGTGIVVDERGYVVTNHHVVNGVDSLRVTLVNGATYDAAVISEDHARDLAIIKINSTSPLTVAPIGTSSDLMLGETVFAVGNAFGYENTVTLGIISALGRDVEVNETQSYRNLIQTDASINPGNSGGPLINMRGEIIGINVAIRAGAQRIGFAIPIDDARQVIAELLNIERLNQTSHGLVSRDLKTATQQQLVVSSAQPNSPAAEAGFKAGDVVVKVDKSDVSDAADFERLLLGRTAGDKVDVTVKRNDKTETLSLKLGKSTGTGFAANTPNVVIRGNNDSLADRIWNMLGVRVAGVASNDQNLTNTKYRGGLQVVAVRKDSPAHISGIVQKDILVGLDKYETITQENISWILEHNQPSAQNPLKFHVVRNRQTLWGQLQFATQTQQTQGQ